VSAAIWASNRAPEKMCAIFLPLRRCEANVVAHKSEKKLPAVPQHPLSLTTIRNAVRDAIAAGASRQMH